MKSKRRQENMRSMRKLGWLVIGIALALVGTDAGRAQIGNEAARAQDLLNLARTAIGGEAKIKEVKGLSINGRIRDLKQDPNATRELKMQFFMADKIHFGEKMHIGEGPMPEGGERHIIIRRSPEASGETMKLEEDTDANGTQIRKRIMIQTDGHHVEGSGDAVSHPRVSLMMPDLMLGLLLNSPIPQEFTFAGETQDGRANIIDVKGPMGGTSRLLLDKATNLPVEFSFKGGGGPVVMFMKKAETPGTETEVDVIKTAPFNVRIPGPEQGEVVVRFSDHRLVDGVVLPYRITKVVNGEIAEEWEIDRYEINPKMEFRRHPQKVD
jgi:hypothetical protein